MSRTNYSQNEKEKMRKIIQAGYKDSKFQEAIRKFVAFHTGKNHSN